MKANNIILTLLFFISVSTYGQRTEWNANVITEVFANYYSPFHSLDLPFKSEIVFNGFTQGDSKTYSYRLRFYETPSSKFISSVNETEKRYLIIYYVPFEEFDFYHSFYEKGKDSLRIRFTKKEDWENLNFVQESFVIRP